MTFRIFANSTTADSSDVNDNYYWIAQGSILPMNGSLLGNTDGTLNLGSSSYKWNEIYCDNIITDTLNTDNNTWETVYNGTLDSNSSSWEMTINDTDNNFYIFGMLITETSTASYIELLTNGVTSGASIRPNVYYYSDAGSAISPPTNYTFNHLLYNAAATTTAIKSYFFSKITTHRTGAERVFMNNYCSGIADELIGTIGQGGGLIQEVGTLTTLSLVPTAGDIIAGSYITLMRTSKE